MPVAEAKRIAGSLCHCEMFQDDAKNDSFDFYNRSKSPKKRLNNRLVDVAFLPYATIETDSTAAKRLLLTRTLILI